MSEGWIGIDLDGTLAEYDGWKGVEHIGKPIPSMVERVKAWIIEGKDVRIFTARVCMSQSKKDFTTAYEAIAAWCRKYIGKELKITAEKDWKMIKLWDDRCVSVIPNTGEIIPLDSNERVKELEAERDRLREALVKLKECLEGYFGKTEKDFFEDCNEDSGELYFADVYNVAVNALKKSEG